MIFFLLSLGSRLKPLLRLVKVVLEFGVLGHATRDFRLGCYGDGSDGVILLMRHRLCVGYVEMA